MASTSNSFSEGKMNDENPIVKAIQQIDPKNSLLYVCSCPKLIFFQKKKVVVLLFDEKTKKPFLILKCLPLAKGLGPFFYIFSPFDNKTARELFKHTFCKHQGYSHAILPHLKTKRVDDFDLLHVIAKRFCDSVEITQIVKSLKLDETGQ